MKKSVKRIIIFLIAVIVLIIAYLIYILVSYDRIKDNQFLEVSSSGEFSYFADYPDMLDTSRPYNIMTYNIGFGAYPPNYSCFADGGKSSWAESEESVMGNVCDISNFLSGNNPDFIFLQEVDLDGTRSYHVDEMNLLNQFVKGYYYDFAVNYDSDFLMYPLYHPYGKNKSGIVTYSKGKINEAVRHSLPIPTDLSKFVDLDRCYSVTKILLDNEKTLCLYNVHLSAYTSDASVRDAQIDMLLDDMAMQYKMGNYVVCGGDFNSDLRDGNEIENAPVWAKKFDRERLPAGFTFAMDRAVVLDIEHDTCRNADEPYNPNTTSTVAVDGFIVSDNINVDYYRNFNLQYKYSDHDPVIMQFYMRSDEG